MAIKTKEELIQLIAGKLSEDDDMTILEDVTDTYDALNVHDPFEDKYNQAINDLNDLKARYKARFVTGAAAGNEDVTIDDEIEESDAPKTFEDLFEIKED